ncbi:DUF4178 domain-containing protein [Megalodesulfovibrio paquesii]
MSLFSRILGTLGGNSGRNRAPARTDLTLKDLLPGDLVDHDLATWKVRAVNCYDFKDFRTREWQLESGAGLRYLELEEDDEPYWSLSQTFPFQALGQAQCERVRASIRDSGDPPDTLTHEGRTYRLEDMAGGHYFKDCVGTAQPFLQWHYVADNGEGFLCIEQWGEDDFEACTGHEVHAWQFTNLLPGTTGE